ncbi:uncharacterized protein LOC123553231 [Mercenaria mercenaria]|uniref:uncharacterized protein LOC123553231 n=1 Tax=Mercenaria mercenaria TaxID=6596 RepID=UPI00234E7DA5|nr:uncharacterized protein LOC123553231 [Mercenaria mercenaria]
MDEMDPHERSMTEFIYQNTLSQNNYSDLTNMSVSLMNFTQQQIVQSHTVTVLLNCIYFLDKFGVPVLLTVGVLSNLILSITIRNSELKKVSACCYFLSMGIVDTFYLIAMAIPWISIRVVDIYNTEGFCQLVYYLNLLTTFLSSWYIVMLLIERLCVCYRPETAQKYMNAFRVKCYITLISIFSIVGHLYLTWTSGVFIFQNRQICNVIPAHAQDIMIMRKIDIILSFILPAVLSITISIPLLIHLCASNCKYFNNGILKVEVKMITLEMRLNSKQTTRYAECPSSSRTDDQGKIQKMNLWIFSQSRRLTVTSVFIALTYTFLFIPNNVIKTRLTFLSGDHIVSFEDSLFLKLFEDLYQFNFAYKAFIYFLFLPEMRKQFTKIFFRTCKRVRTMKQHRNGLTVT